MCVGEGRDEIVKLTAGDEYQSQTRAAHFSQRRHRRFVDHAVSGDGPVVVGRKSAIPTRSYSCHPSKTVFVPHHLLKKRKIYGAKPRIRFASQSWMAVK